MLAAEGNDGSSWLRRVTRNRTCRRSCGLAVVISSFIICLTGFLLAILSYKKILSATWAPLGLSCGVPASCVCTFAFIYCLFRWDEDGAAPTRTDQDRIERSEPNEETPLLASTEQPTEEGRREEAETLPELEYSLDSKASRYASAEALTDSTEPKSEYTDALTDSNGKNAEDSNTESTDFTESSESKIVVKGSKSEEKHELNEGSGEASEVVSELKCLEKHEVKFHCGSSIGSGESFAVIDKPKSLDEKGEITLEGGTTEMSLAHLKLPERSTVEVCHETKLYGVSASSEISILSKESEVSVRSSPSTQSKSEDLKSEGSEAQSTNQDESPNSDEKPVSKDLP